MMDSIQSEEDLDELLAEPSQADVEALKRLDGDLLILGAAGKMGPSLARRARKAMELSGRSHLQHILTTGNSAQTVTAFFNDGQERWGSPRGRGASTMACPILTDQPASLGKREQIRSRQCGFRRMGRTFLPEGHARARRLNPGSLRIS